MIISEDRLTVQKNYSNIEIDFNRRQIFYLQIHIFVFKNIREAAL